MSEAYEEIVVHLGRPEDLVAVDPLAVLDDAPARSVPGVDEVLGELLARPRLRSRRRIVLTLPPDPDADDEALGRRLAGAIARWCRARMEHAERTSRGAWRQGLSSLRGGLVLFVVGLALSTDFLEPDVPEVLQNLLGDGVFLVIAWIGLWYPLDLLFFARSPLRREMRALDRMGQMPVEIRRRPAP